MPRGMFESSPLEIQRMVQEQNLVCPGRIGRNGVRASIPFPFDQQPRLCEFHPPSGLEASITAALTPRAFHHVSVGKIENTF